MAMVGYSIECYTRSQVVWLAAVQVKLKSLNCNIERTEWIYFSLKALGRSLNPNIDFL